MSPVNLKLISQRNSKNGSMKTRKIGISPLFLVFGVLSLVRERGQGPEYELGF